MTGAPMSGVTAASGSGVVVNAVVIRLHSNETVAPITTVWRKSFGKLSLFKMRREICGTAKPMNDTGPQNAVTMAVRMPVISSVAERRKLTDMPRLVAYWPPN